METRANYLIIGLFTLAIVLSGFGFAFWIARYGDGGDARPVTVTFKGAIEGLNPGSKVLFNGIKVGEVATLKLDKSNPQIVHALISVRADAPVMKDTEASLGFVGLSGVAHVKLEGGTPNGTRLFDEPLGSRSSYRLKASPSAVQDLMAGARDLLRKVDKIVTRVDGIVVANEASINTSVKNVEVFTSALAANSKGIDVFLANIAKAADKIEKLAGKLDVIVAAIEPDKVKSTIGNIETFSAKLPGIAEDTSVMMAEAKVAATNLKAFSAQLDTTMKDVKKLVAAIDASKVAKTVDNVETFSGALARNAGNVDKVMADAVAIADQLKKASGRIDKLMAQVDGLLGSAQTGGFLSEATSAAQSIRKVADAFAARANEISGGLARFTGRGLRDVEGLVAQGRRTLSNLDRLINAIERDPQRFLFGNTRQPTYNSNRR